MTSDKDTKHADRFLSTEQILRLLPIAESTLRRMIDKGLFPEPYRPSPRRKLWKESDIVEWQRDLPPGHPFLDPVKSRHKRSRAVKSGHKKAGK